MPRGFLTGCEPDGCLKCPLIGCTKVPPEGNPHAKIAIVGMGPGRREEVLGRPFTGDSGDLLNRMLGEVGLARKDLWITNVAACMPGPVGLSNGGFIPKARVEKDSMLKHCRDHVLRELGVVKPRVVVAFGTLTAQAITDDREGITQIHGSINKLSSLTGHNAIVIPLFHPAHLLRGEQRFYPAVVAGLARAKRLSEQGFTSPGSLFLVDPLSGTIDADIDRLDSLVNELIASGEDISVDVETTSEHPTKAALTVFGFGLAARRLGVAVTVRSWNNLGGRFEWLWSQARWDRVFAILLRLWRGHNTKQLWNWGFDVTVGERFFGPVGGRVRDGMILHHLDYPDMLHRLDFAVQTLLDVEPWKYIYRNKAKSGTATHRDLLVYNAQDCLYTALVFPLVEANTRMRRNLHLENHQLALSDLARRMHINGIPINKEAWQKAHAKATASRDAAMKIMRDAIVEREDAGVSLSQFVHAARQARAEPGKTVEFEAVDIAAWNPNSADHARWYLYDFLRVQPTRWTTGGAERDVSKQQPSHSYKGVLVYMGNPLVKAYVDRAEHEATLRALETVRSSVDPITWILHPSWSATSMKGTRFVSRPNCQNWDTLLKELTDLTGTKYKWVGADAAQLEYRISAFLAGIPELLELFNGPTFDEEKEEWKKYDARYDGHALIAAEVFGDTFTKGDKKTKKALRTMVKRVVYALFYGAYPDKIYQTILEDRHVPSEFRAFVAAHPEYIERIHSGFSARFPEWDRFAQREILQVRMNGEQVIAPFNRHRPWALPGMVEETKIRNTPIQLSAGEIVNAIFLRMDRAVREQGIRAWFAVHGHDACEWVVHEDDAEKLKALVNRAFDVVLERGGGESSESYRSIHIYGQARIGDSLAQV